MSASFRCAIGRCGAVVASVYRHRKTGGGARNRFLPSFDLEPLAIHHCLFRLFFFQKGSDIPQNRTMIHDCGHSNVQTSTFNVATLAIGPFLIYFKMVLLISTVYRCLGLSGRLPAEPHPPHLWDAFFVINSSIPSFPSSSHYHAAACAPDIVSAFQMCWIYSTTADDELHGFVKQMMVQGLSRYSDKFGWDIDRS
jgi:hypothetical protein